MTLEQEKEELELLRSQLLKQLHDKDKRKELIIVQQRLLEIDRRQIQSTTFEDEIVANFRSIIRFWSS
jgi:hypothetical protein